MKALTILVLDDHKIIRDTISRASLVLFPDAEIIEAKRISDATPYLSKIQIAFIDIQLGKVGTEDYEQGTDLIETIVKNYPSIKIVISTSLNDDARLLHLYREYSPIGFLTKTDLDQIYIKEALTTIVEGGTFYSDELIDARKRSEKIILLDPQLTWKHHLVLLYMKQGMTNAQISQEFECSVKTIERMKVTIREIFNADKRKNLVLEAEKRGLL